jgi:DNA-binding MarR family transcriptional regulator
MPSTRPVGRETTTRAAMTRRDATDEEARALASTMRLKILRMCREPRTNKEIADVLGSDPGTTLHHVRRLVDTGFLVAQPARRGTRSWEVPYLATGKSWQISSPAADRSNVDVFLDEISKATPDQVDTTWLGLRLGPADMEEFRGQLRHLLDEFADRPDDPTQPAWSLFISLHPDPNRP